MEKEVSRGRDSAHCLLHEDIHGDVNCGQEITAARPDMEAPFEEMRFLHRRMASLDDDGLVQHDKQRSHGTLQSTRSLSGYGGKSCGAGRPAGATRWEQARSTCDIYNDTCGEPVDRAWRAQKRFRKPTA